MSEEDKSESFQSASLSSLRIVSSSIPYMIRLQIIFDFLSDSLFLRRLFFRFIRDVSAYIFVIKSSCVDADEFECYFFFVSALFELEF